MTLRKVYVEMIADLFHYGHAEFLRKAKALGDYLVVGLLSDEWAEAYKQRPVMTLEERKRALASCRYVDEVIAQAEPASAEWIAAQGFAQTAIAFRNASDQQRHLATSIGYDRSREAVLPYEQTISTTDILQRIEQRLAMKAQEITTIKQAFAPRWSGGEWLLAEQMLRDVSELFTQQNVHFFLLFGTLLGAARHQGVIPWDDDIDIAVFEQDEEKLLALQPAFEALGYRMMKLTKKSDRGTDIFYKLWIAASPSHFTLPYAWPFIDIFIVRSAAEPELLQIDLHPFPREYFLPLQTLPFSGLTLPVPHNLDILNLMYSADCLTVCASANFCHRLEQHVEQIRRPALQVQDAGGYIDMHAMAKAVSEAVPERLPGWTVSRTARSVYLIRGRVNLHISEAIAELWNRIENRSVTELAILLRGPKIEVLYQLLEILKELEKQHAITVPVRL